MFVSMTRAFGKSGKIAKAKILKLWKLSSTSWLSAKQSLLR
jgi:hypothetical protein